ncbi:hypothetical protein CRUP_034971 [Coryphaenoides rupestris]|nr:hypothetical protein CRUP_034971 [Coryphaenoides rupestris]
MTSSNAHCEPIRRLQFLMSVIMAGKVRGSRLFCQATLLQFPSSVLLTTWWLCGYLPTPDGDVQVVGEDQEDVGLPRRPGCGSTTTSTSSPQSDADDYKPAQKRVPQTVSRKRHSRPPSNN